MVETAFVVLFVFCRADENAVIPLVGKVSDVAYGNVHAFIFRALDKGRKAVVITPDVDKPPMIFFAHCFQVVYVFSLKSFVIFAGVRAGREFIIKILFEFCKFSHSFNSPLTDLVADGSKVSLVNGLGVKADTGVTVQNGKIILDSNNISAETFGGNTFFIEIAGANGNLYIPAILA